MKMRSFTRSLVCASLLALVSTGVNAAEKVTLKLAHNLERSHVVHQSFEELAKEVKQLSKGNMVIRIYPSSQMGNARETMELLQNGALDMTKGSASDLESLIIFMLSIICRSYLKIRRTSTKWFLVKLVKKLWIQQKIKAFCFISLCSGYTQFLCEKTDY